MGMKVKVRAFAALHDLIGGSVVLELPEGSTVRSLLEELARRFGRAFREAVLDEGGGLAKFVKVLVNGRDIDFLSGLDTALEDGDEVFLFPPVGGG